jgi:hypothetical protein
MPGRLSGAVHLCKMVGCLLARHLQWRRVLRVNFLILLIILDRL